MSVYYPQCAVILRILWEDFSHNKKIGALNTAALNRVYALPIQARRIRVSVNDYTQADTFDLEIDYKNFPFDPRCIRACGVSIFLEDQAKLIGDDGNPITLKPSANNVIFQGFADTENIDFDDENRTVKMEGRDFTALLIDKKYPGTELDTDTPLDELIQGFLDAIPEFAQSSDPVTVVNRTGQDLPTLSTFAPDYELNSTKTKKHAKPNSSYWDLIQDLVQQAALIAYIEIDKLVITKPRVLYNKNAAKQFVYGKNLTALEFKRKLGRKKGFNIRCSSLIDKVVQDAKIPLEGDPAWLKDLGLAAEAVQIPQVASDGTQLDPKEAPYIGFRFPNLVKKQLIQVGQKIFEEISRQQLEGSFSTKEMEVSDASGNCFDLVELNIGTPLNIQIDQGDLQGISKLTSVAARTKFLLDRCYAPAVAYALAQTLGKFSLTFYTKSFEFLMDQEEGFQLKVNFINFIEIDQRGLGIG